MTSDPPPSDSGGSALPPRHRPTLGNLAKDTTELDLWAFEDDLDLAEDASEPMTEESLRGPASDIPAPRERQVTKARDAQPPLQPGIPAGGERIQMNVNKSRAKKDPAGPIKVFSIADSDLDDLEHWEDVPKGPQIDDLPADKIQHVPELPIHPEVAAPVDDQPAPASEEPAEQAKPAPAAVAEDDEFSPAPRADGKPLNLHPRWTLSQTERIGLITLLALLLVGGLGTLVVSLNRLPTESIRAGANDFPIKGGKVTIDSAVSYWRAPITEGTTADTFRRGTRLLPVLELKIGGGTGAIRVLFRNDERVVIGDAVTRAVRGADSLKIAATAGFDDPGMHAAYRTGESKPWTIEVFEAASEDATGSAFKKLFEMNISTDRR